MINQQEIPESLFGHSDWNLLSVICFELPKVVVVVVVVIIIIVIIIMIIIIIAFKGAIRDFFAISLLRREQSPTRTRKWSRCNCVQITCNTSSAYHMQK